MRNIPNDSGIKFGFLHYTKVLEDSSLMHLIEPCLPMFASRLSNDKKESPIAGPGGSFPQMFNIHATYPES